jgi:hypothetical protein
MTKREAAWYLIGLVIGSSLVVVGMILEDLDSRRRMR